VLVELDDVRDLLAGVIAEQGKKGSGRLREQVLRAAGELDAVGRRLETEIASGTGLSVEAAAEYLGVSAQTVRTWLARGVLEQVPRAKPAQIDRASARRAHRLLSELRERGRERDWLGALVDALHDAGDRRDEGVRKGLREFARGEIEPA
jgi:hypothetical protein